VTVFLAGPASEGPTLWTFFGRFHPATVHFPIALVTLAGGLELWQVIRRKPGFAPATPVLSSLGLASSLLATLMGWANGSDRKHDDVMEAHRWAGVVTTGVALAATILVTAAPNRSGWIVHAGRASLFVGMLLVGVTGHWGGHLVHGKQYYSSGAPPWLSGFFPAEPLGGPGELPGEPGSPRASGKVDFEKEVAPILEANCLRCHSPLAKVEGKLRLDTRVMAMKGSENGKVLLEGNPAGSTLYSLLLETDAKDRMPAKAKPLPRAEIETIRRWIQEGASWPAGIVLKPPARK